MKTIRKGFFRSIPPVMHHVSTVHSYPQGKCMKALNKSEVVENAVSFGDRSEMTHVEVEREETASTITFTHRTLSLF